MLYSADLTKQDKTALFHRLIHVNQLHIQS